jgi:hypothetical protein
MTISNLIQYIEEAIKDYEEIAEDEGQMGDMDSHEYYMKEIEVLSLLIEKLRTMRGGASVLALGLNVTSTDSEGVGVANLKRAYTALKVRRARLECKKMELDDSIAEIDATTSDLRVEELLVADQLKEGLEK